MRSSMLVEPLDQRAAAAAVERHRVGLGDEGHPAADPLAVEVEVLAALRRADPAELGVDRASSGSTPGSSRRSPSSSSRARRSGVATVTRSSGRYGATIASSPPTCSSKGRCRRRVDEQPAVPLDGRASTAARTRLVEALEVAEAAGAARSAAVQLVGPGVVGQTSAPALRLVPHGSSSWPRCRQAFANARSAPSSSRISSTPPAPVSTAAGCPARRSVAACRRTASRRRRGPLPLQHRGIEVRRRGQHPRRAERSVRRRPPPRGQRSAASRAVD